MHGKRAALWLALIGSACVCLCVIVGCGSGRRPEPPRQPSAPVIEDPLALYNTIRIVNDSSREACGVILNVQGEVFLYPELEGVSYQGEVIAEASEFQFCQQLGQNELLLYHGQVSAGGTLTCTFLKTEGKAVQIRSARWIGKGESAQFADQALRAAILEATLNGAPPSPSATSRPAQASPDVQLLDALLLTELDASQRGVADLRGIEECRSLSTLKLAGNQIRDVTPLAALGTLRKLDLSSNPLGSIEPLSGLALLRELDLSRTGIAGCPAPLARLTSLTALSLAGNRIDDVTALSAMTSLASLDLSGNRIVDIGPLRPILGLIPLERPELALSCFTTAVRDLRLGSNEIADVSVLEGTSVQRLDLSNNQVENAGPLRGMSCLLSADLSGNRIASLPEFQDCPKLYSVNLARNLITGVTLRRTALASLGTLCLRGNRISRLRVVGGLRDPSRLRVLDLSANDLREVADLALLPELTMLLVSDNAIQDLVPLSNLRSLQYLDLSRNAVMDIGPICHLGGLEMLWLRGNPIEEIASLPRISFPEGYDSFFRNPMDGEAHHYSCEWPHVDLRETAVVDIVPLAQENLLPVDSVVALSASSELDRGRPQINSVIRKLDERGIWVCLDALAPPACQTSPAVSLTQSAHSVQPPGT